MNAPASLNGSRSVRGSSAQLESLTDHVGPLPLPNPPMPLTAEAVMAWVRARQNSPFVQAVLPRALFGGHILSMPIGGGAVPLLSRVNETKVLAFQPTHLGELIQLAVTANNGIETALITLPHAERGCWVMATWTAGRTWRVIVVPRTKKRIARCIQELLARCKMWELKGTLRIEALPAPTPLMKGQGSSTADCVAAVTAVAAVLGISLTDAAVAKIVHAAEGASDPLPFVHHGVTVVYRSRAGVVHEVIQRALPRMLFAGFGFDGGPRLTTGGQIDQTEYGDADVEAASPIYARAKKAIRQGDATGLLLASNQSLHLNQRIRRTFLLGELDALAQRNGGHLVASHSGDAAAIGFDPMKTEGLPRRVARTIEGLKDLAAKDIHLFATPGEIQ